MSYEHRVDGEVKGEGPHPAALSDTEVEVSDRRSNNYWEHKSKVVRRSEHSSKVSTCVCLSAWSSPSFRSQGEASSHAGTSPSDEELRERLKQHQPMASGE